MTDDPRHQAILAVLAENGATAPETDLDTLASRIVAVLDNTAPAPGTVGNEAAGETNADHTATP